MTNAENANHLAVLADKKSPRPARLAALTYFLDLVIANIGDYRKRALPVKPDPKAGRVEFAEWARTADSIRSKNAGNKLTIEQQILATKELIQAAEEDLAPTERILELEQWQRELEMFLRVQYGRSPHG